MQFKKYQKLERFGRTNVENIEIGKCVIFPKLDGTNGSCWLRDGELKAGSRNRELTLDNDNAGFYAHLMNNENIKAYLKKNPKHRLYGEWLVPHSLKTYKDKAWKRFYIFDVCIDREDGSVEYLPYNIYKELLDEFELDYIPPLGIITNASYEQLIHYLDKNNFLIEDGQGNGEGVVIKNYDYVNRFGNQVWAKIVTSEFKEKHIKKMGAPEIINRGVEDEIINEYFTEAFIEKEFAKFTLENDGFNSKDIPKLFEKIWYEFITEESWNMIKQYKKPTINYSLLYGLCINKIKEVKKDIFY